VAAVLFASLSPLRGLRRFYLTFLNEEREKRDTRVCLFEAHTYYFRGFFVDKNALLSPSSLCASLCRTNNA
jgi:hypothetical protein